MVEYTQEEIEEIREGVRQMQKQEEESYQQYFKLSLENFKKLEIYQDYSKNLKIQKGSKDVICVVSIRQQYLKELPFGSVQSRPALSMIWSFYGDNYEVSKCMQEMSHKTRAYFINAELLQGFLVSKTAIFFRQLITMETSEQAYDKQNELKDTQGCDGQEIKWREKAISLIDDIIGHILFLIQADEKKLTDYDYY